MAENIPIRDESNYPNRPLGVAKNWSLERFLRVSWGAIFAGFVVAFATLVLLILLGAAIGLSVFDAGEAGSAEAWGWGAAIWWILTTLIAMFVGGLVAGRLAGIPRSLDSMLHGIATWALVIVASMLLAGTATGRVLGAATGMAGNTVAGVSPQQQQQGEPMSQQQPTPEQRQMQQRVVQDIRSESQQLAQGNPQLQRQVNTFITELQEGNADESKLVDAMTQAGIEENQAEDIVDRWVEAFDETQPGMFDRIGERTAERAATTGAGVAWAAFIGTLLGALAAMGGGWLGTPEDISRLGEHHHRHGGGEHRTTGPTNL